jgi:hypothetical protein
MTIFVRKLFPCVFSKLSPYQVSDTKGARLCCLAKKIRLFNFGFVRNSPMFKVAIKNVKETYQNYGETVEPVWVDYYQLLKSHVDLLLLVYIILKTYHDQLN